MNAIPLSIGLFAADEDLIAATNEDRKPHLRVAAVDSPVVVLGRGSRPEAELRLENCLADRVPLQRRRGGGCSVYLDEGNVVVSLCLPVVGIGGNHDYFTRISAWLIRALSLVGVEGVYVESLSDLVIGNRKIGGASIHRSKDVLYYSSTLLVSPDVVRMERYLAHPPKEPVYRKGRRHRDFVGAIALPPTAPEIPVFVRHLEDALVTTLPRLVG